MSKTIKSSQIELPPHLGVYPKSLPVYKIDHAFLGNEDPNKQWENRINMLKDSFGIDGQLSDAGDRLVLQDKENIRVLQMYKPSDSFLYFDRSLVSPTDPKYADSILSAEVAKQRAHLWIEKNGLLNQYPVYQGLAYTKAIAFQADINQYAEKQSEDKEYNTEIKACFGFQIEQTPVLGPGAKIMISFAGDTMSQVAYFWRNPVTSPVGEQKIFPPESVKRYLARDPRFAHLDPLESKIRINEINLGYYALSPYAIQRYYFPVYQLKGIVETRGGHNAQGLDAVLKKKGSIVKETLQYNFNYYLPAGHMSIEEYKMSGFPHPVKGSFIF